MEPLPPPGKDPERWKYRLLRIEREGLTILDPNEPVVSFHRGQDWTIYFQLVDTKALPLLGRSLGFLTLLSIGGFLAKRKRSN